MNAFSSKGKKLLFLLFNIIIFQIHITSAATLYWYPKSISDSAIEDPGNWILSTGAVNTAAITDADDLNFQKSKAALHYHGILSNALTIRNFFIDTGKIEFRNTLTLKNLTTSIKGQFTMYYPAEVTFSGNGKFAYTDSLYNLILIQNYPNITLSPEMFPTGSGVVKACSLQLRSTVATLKADLYIVGELSIGQSSSVTRYSKLFMNGKSVTIGRHSTFNLVTSQEIFPDENSEFTILNQSGNSPNLNFKSDSGGIPKIKALKILRKNSSTVIRTVNIISDLHIIEEFNIEKYTRFSYSGNIILGATRNKKCKFIASNTSVNIYKSSGTGKITAQLFIPEGRRVFRYINNPFRGTLSLAQLTDSIDITGNGGSSNGFTTTNTNNPSCFYFNPANSDGNTSGLDAGWTAFANANTNNWTRNQSILVYIRGSKGQGLDGTSYTPDSVTIDIQSSDTIYYGDQAFSATSSANSTWVSFGNPYISPIEIGNQPSSQRNNIGNNFYVFDANLGASGGFITKSFGTSYVLPALSGFFTNTSATSTQGRITFSETDKSSSSGDDIFTRTPSPNRLNIEIFKGDRMYDATDLVLDSGLTQKFDAYDAEKMSNFDLNLFTVSTEGKHLAINQALFEAGNIIPLGIETAESGDFTFQIPNNSFPENYKLTLIDALKKTSTDLTGGSSYSFQIDSKNTASFQNRFAIQVDATQKTQNLNDAKCVIYPNPAANNESIEIMANQPIYKVELFDLNGKLVTTLNGQKYQHLQLPSQELKEGIFIAKIHFLNQISTQKIIIK
jgi:hypothetical protein